MCAGVLEPPADTQDRGNVASLYARSFRGPLMSLVPQAPAAWYRQLGLAPVQP